MGQGKKKDKSRPINLTNSTIRIQKRYARTHKRIGVEKDAEALQFDKLPRISQLIIGAINSELRHVKLSARLKRKNKYTEGAVEKGTLLLNMREDVNEGRWLDPLSKQTSLINSISQYNIERLAQEYPEIQFSQAQQSELITLYYDLQNLKSVTEEELKASGFSSAEEYLIHYRTHEIYIKIQDIKKIEEDIERATQEICDHQGACNCATLDTSQTEESPATEGEYNDIMGLEDTFLHTIFTNI